MNGRKWLWIGVPIVAAIVAAGFIYYRPAAPAPAGPATKAARKASAPARDTILTQEGWGAIRVGMPVDDAMRAAGLSLRRPGHYDDVFADEPDRLVSCNIYGIVGAPPNISVFVEDRRVTSIGVGLPDESGGAIFRTDRGVRLGDPESAVRRAYPRLEQEPNIYSEPPDKMLFFRGPNGLGIKFSIMSGRVQAIDVGGPSINYVEGCL